MATPNSRENLTDLALPNQAGPREAIQVVEANGSRVLIETAAANVQAIRLEGEFDLTCATLLSNPALAALQTGNDVIIDLSRATFIDSTMLFTIATIHRRATESKHAAVVQLGDDRIIRRVLELTHLNDLLPCCYSRDEALTTIKARALRPKQH